MTTAKAKSSQNFLDTTMTRPSHGNDLGNGLSRRSVAGSLRVSALCSALATALLTSCSSVPSAPSDTALVGARDTASVGELIRAHQAATSDRVPPASAQVIEDRILALDPSH